MQTNNKYKINIWGSIFFLLMALVYYGCTEDDSGIETDGSAIVFDCSTTGLRATEAIDDEMQYFRVSAIWTKEDNTCETFMDGQLVEKQSDKWVYSPIKRWPMMGSVSFFAYSPATSSGMSSFSINKETNKLSILYTVNKKYQDQEDFKVATKLDEKYSPIMLKFNHVLASVNVKARGFSDGKALVIKEVKFPDLFSSGTFEGIGDASSWKNRSTYNDYTVYQKYPLETKEDEYRDVGSLMLLPQSLNDDFEIFVTYDEVDGSEDQMRSQKLPDGFAFEKGKKYIFMIDLSSSGNPAPPAKISKQDVNMPQGFKLDIICEENEN